MHIKDMQTLISRLETQLKSENETVEELKCEIDRGRDAFHRLKQESDELNLRYCRLQKSSRQSHTVVDVESALSDNEKFLHTPIPKPQNIDLPQSHALKAKPIQNTPNKPPEDDNTTTQARHKGPPKYLPTKRSIRVRSPVPSEYDESDRSVIDYDSDMERRAAYPLPRRHESYHKGDGSDRRQSYYDVGDNNSSSIIKFLNVTVPKFCKKGSAEIAEHLDLYQSTMDYLKLYSDADRIRFLPWVFENKNYHYFTSFRERGIQRWQDVSHEVKLEFGPFRAINAEKRDIYKLTCKANQSPREFLSLLKNAYGLAYRSPNWESGEFKQLFYDAMPMQIKFSLARDLDLNAPLDRLVTAATTLYNISECHAIGDKRYGRSPEQRVAETKIEHNLRFETQSRSFPQSTGPLQQTQQNQVRPKQTKPHSPNGSSGDTNGNNNSHYRPQYNGRGPPRYRRWNNRPRQQTEGRPVPFPSPRSRSPTSNQSTLQNQGIQKSNDRVDKLADQVAKLTEMVNKLTQGSTERQKSFLAAAAGPKSAP
ncbi:LOW QUALITY PROTEIN: uncharacterized protein LOC130274585 [Hyla sarda]|uniref:LOW QUALITY PROTEIN: uncharacterized protein LOC130274585 n=1 Tax=Hyla sarda TaxID=327740 RepID=UPI0024C41AAD|nr:LOW QUALITY PROTEIN: uncharacterized protein LOC130274585 [Hyla sarda]